MLLWLALIVAVMLIPPETKAEKAKRKAKEEARG